MSGKRGSIHECLVRATPNLNSCKENGSTSQDRQEPSNRRSRDHSRTRSALLSVLARRPKGDLSITSITSRKESRIDGHPGSMLARGSGSRERLGLSLIASRILIGLVGEEDKRHAGRRDVDGTRSGVLVARDGLNAQSPVQAPVGLEDPTHILSSPVGVTEG